MFPLSSHVLAATLTSRPRAFCPALLNTEPSEISVAPVPAAKVICPAPNCRQGMLMSCAIVAAESWGSVMVMPEAAVVCRTVSIASAATRV
jgi:hypothetical protein